MSDQYESMEDLLVWDDWLQMEQPHWQIHGRKSTLCVVDLSLPHAGVTSNVCQPFYENPTIMGPESESLNPLWISSSLHDTQTEEPSHQEFFPVIQNEHEQKDGDPSASQKEEQSLPANFNLRTIYPKSTCASCDGQLIDRATSLDFQDLYCTRSRAATHPAIVCELCGEKFENINALKKHSRAREHRSFECAIPGCEASRTSHSARLSVHFVKSHPDIKYGCAQCGLEFDTHELLAEHGTNFKHTAYTCHFPDCGSGAARLADLLRHQLTHISSVARHPCPHCRRHRGTNGFKRKDHLRQHIRNYHHIEADGSQSGPLTFECPREGCDRIGSTAFEDKKLLQLHLRKDHDSPFQCPQPGCHRVGTKGWMRQFDMVKHVRKVHGVSQ